MATDRFVRQDSQGGTYTTISASVTAAVAGIRSGDMTNLTPGISVYDANWNGIGYQSLPAIPTIVDWQWKDTIQMAGPGVIRLGSNTKYIIIGVLGNITGTPTRLDTDNVSVWTVNP